MGNVQRAMCSGMLALQAVVLFLTTPVMLSLSDVATGTGLALGLGLTLACLVALGLMRSPLGAWPGWAVQAASIALGLVVSAMYLLGLIFASLYAGSYFLGAKVDRERAERAALEPPAAG
jgi:hypothetical protein